MNALEIQHLAFVLAHNGLFPEPGFGGCNCLLCEQIRITVENVKRTEANDFVREFCSPVVHPENSKESVNQAQDPVVESDCGVEQSGSSLGS